jgi:hypothetical protein
MTSETTLYFGSTMEDTTFYNTDESAIYYAIRANITENCMIKPPLY